ncbi:histone-lysine N-methyltransferase SETMAR-like [Ditylenchus destructor]|uniref:Histone-lysine N-methyltransferase SETMAR-like n=1 Tax=Ditylenchus destructor TaxID=166010 RepID=A0AAD4N971_9BILA|nr:histone-lysine N-methyltransferase SETMAR-like [Ditylenchus destructor]
MQKDENYIAHCLLFQFHLGKSVTEAHDTLCAFYGKKVVKRSICEQYFERFRTGDTVFDEFMEYEASSDEDPENYFVPTKIRRLHTIHNVHLSQHVPR